MLKLLSNVTAEELESGRTLLWPLLIPLVADHLPPIIVPDVLSRAFGLFFQHGYS
jgi:hypothetical protein